MNADQGDLGLETPQEFSTRLGLTFQDISILARALTHRSYMNENDDALTHPFDVGIVECNKFRPSETAGKANQQQGLVTHIFRAVSEARHDGDEVSHQERFCLPLEHRMGAFNAPHCGLDQNRPGGVAQPLCGMGFCYRSQPAYQGCH